MGEIRKDNLHESLIEELNELRNIDLSGKQDKTDESLLTESKTVIGAINELFQSANNGKELIATAIGEPLTAEDTFSAMSTGINGLLTTFKTNMMNNGVVVEGNDKFKQLIEKLATLTDSEGRGIQYAEGDVSNATNVVSTKVFEVTNLKFTPSIVIFINANNDNGNINECMVYTPNYVYYGYRNASKYSSNVSSSFLDPGDGYYHPGIYIVENGFTIKANIDVQGINKWYAIGVGEEDTTLRDSLASILQDEGVNVTKEDDMASLITKVDEEFDRQVVPTGDAVASNVLTGKTFINSTGSTLSGTMANNGTKTITPSASTQTLGAGYYDNITINGDVDLVPENIVSGKNIFGVTGSATLENVAKAGTTYSLMPYFYTSGTLSQMKLSATTTTFQHMISLFVPMSGTMTLTAQFKAGSSDTTAELKIEQTRNDAVIWSKTLSTTGTTEISIKENISNLQFADVIKLSVRSASGSKGAIITQPVLNFSL